MATILLIDNDTIYEGLAHIARKMAHAELTASSGGRQARASDADLPAMIITAFGAVETTVKAMKLWGFDFLQKPFAPEVVRFKIERTLVGRASGAGAAVGNATG